jgi:glycosyltransferase involved in cell wall biosynthesis
VASAPVTAVVVCHNEADLLPRCLSSLEFCDERIVVDLRSADGAAEVARRLGAKVLSIEPQPIVERSREAGLAAAANDWILLVDPDEEVTPRLAEDVAELVLADDPAIGVVWLPWRFFCKGRPLKGTHWGGTDNSKRVLFHRRRVDPLLPVHQAPIRLHSGLREERIAPRGDNYLNHYWVEDWGSFFEKHRRYLRHEGETGFVNGERFTWTRALARVPYHFYKSLIVERGYRDGLLGVFLSAFWALYNFGAILSLRAYERRRARVPSATMPPAAGA